MKDSDLELYVDEVPKKAAIKLDLTLNPLGCPDRVLSSLNSITRANISSYNEPPELPELKQALARHSNVKENQIMLTCGSDQAIEIVLTQRGIRDISADISQIRDCGKKIVRCKNKAI